MEEQKLTARHLLVAITCIVGIFTTSAITFSCPGLCYKPVANYLGLQVSDVSFYMSIVYFGEVVFSPVVGALLEKVDVRIIGSIAVVCASGSYLAMSQFTAIWQWYIAGVFIGFSQVAILWLITAGVLGRWFKKKLGFFLGLSYAMTGVGGATFNIVGQFVLGPNLLVEETWRNLYMVFGVVCIVALPFYLFAIRNRPQDVGLKAYGEPLVEGEKIDDEHLQLKGFEPKQIYKKWYFYVLIIACCMMNILGIYPQHYTTYYQTVVAVDSAGVAIPDLMILSGTLEAFSMAGMAIGKVVTGAVESKSLQAALILGVITGAGGISCIWFGGFNKILPILFGGGFIYGCVYAWSTVMTPYLTRSVVGDLHYEKIYSVVLVPFNLVGATAASGLAVVNQTFGWSVFFGLDIVLIVLIYILATIVHKVGRKEYEDKILNVA